MLDNDDDDLDLDGDFDINEIANIIVYGTDWTTATILDQLDRNNIQLNPKFQRRDAWSIKRKSRFVESLILGLPVPQIVLAVNPNDKGKYLVLDGKQRLLTILQFYGKSKTKNNSFKLRDLDLRTDLNHLAYEELKSNLLHRSYIDALDNQTIRTTLVRNWGSEPLLHKVFLRLNTENTPLSPQELRQALHPGGFVDFIDDYAFNSRGLKHVFPNGPDYRMRDTEILIRHLGFQLFFTSYTGNLKLFLDQVCEWLNNDWEHRQEEINLILEDFDQAVEITVEIFGKNFARIWLDDKQRYQSRFNRALFEVFIYYFSIKEVRTAAQGEKLNVENTFKKLCSEKIDFVRALERTSKNIRETYTRFSLWGDYLKQTLDLDFSLPKLTDNNRIIFDDY
jgi:hypothetical protein